MAETGQEEPDKGKILSGAAQGASAGSAVGPYGAIIGGAVGFGVGVAQYEKARKELNQLDRPEYEIPEEYKQILTRSEIRAAEGLPTAQKREYIENIARSRQAALTAGETRRAGLSNIMDVQEQEQQAYSNLVTRDAAARRRSQRYLDQRLQMMGQLQDKKFRLNELQPYQAQLQSAQAMAGAGMQNIAQGASNVGTGVTYASAANQGGQQQQGGGQQLPPADQGGYYKGAKYGPARSASSYQGVI